MALLSGDLVFVAAFVSLTGGAIYIRSMLNGKAKPNRVTWLMWAIAPLIATTAEISSNVGLAVVPVFMNGFTPLIIFLSSFIAKRAYWKITKFDYLCGILSALAIILWLITKTPDIAILFAIAADGLAAVPTVIKAWRDPKTESVWVYVSGAFTSIAAYTAINVWTLPSYAFPTYILILNIIIIFGIKRHNH